MSCALAVVKKLEGFKPPQKALSVHCEVGVKVFNLPKPLFRKMGILLAAALLHVCFCRCQQMTCRHSTLAVMQPLIPWGKLNCSPAAGAATTTAEQGRSI
jgi:hypothetical protein